MVEDATLLTIKHIRFMNKNTNTNFVLARTKYQLALPPLVIHIFCPFKMYSFPFFSARVLIPATSDPAPGSVTPYA